MFENCTAKIGLDSFKTAFKPATPFEFETSFELYVTLVVTYTVAK